MYKRNEVEGKFGKVIRRLGSGLIKTKLKEGSETVVALIILSMNLKGEMLSEVSHFLSFKGIFLPKFGFCN